MKTKNALRGLSVAVVLQLGVLSLLMLFLAGGATASAQVVTNSADSGPGTLRSAITNAASGAVITFDPSLSGATITLNNTLTINTNLTIDASALPGGLQINGNGSVQIFNVASNITVYLNSLTITNGYTTNYGGGIYNGGTLTLTNCTLSGNSAANLGGASFNGSGGAIFNGGDLTLNQCTLSGNSAYYYFTLFVNYGAGGGICTVAGTVTLNQCTLSGNSATDGGVGGGINIDSGTLALNQCTLSGNSASYSGGGININGGTVTLNQCTLSGNSAPSYGYGGGIYNDDTLTLNQCTLSGNSAPSYGYGGGIYNDDTLTLNQCTLSANSASDYGGGIANYGILTLTNCALSGNSASFGGGIFNYIGDILTLNQCTLSGNRAYYGSQGAGGGIDNYGTLTLTNCILSGNSAELYGGGIYNDDTLTLNQCTLSGNTTVNGGGIYNYSGPTLTLNQCTLSGNSGDYGGGIDNGLGTLTMTNTIVAGNSGSVDIFNSGVVTYGDSNLVQSIYSGGTITGPAPLTNAPDLAPLGNYGGPTQTMPPLPGSPAIGAGSVAANTFATDQRGYPRTQNGLIDLGAVELQSSAANPPVLGNITVPAGGGNGLQFTFTSAPAADFTVLTATNVSLALTNWTVLGEVQQVAPGQYQFTDPQAATNAARFYRVRSP